MRVLKGREMDCLKATWCRKGLFQLTAHNLHLLSLRDIRAGTQTGTMEEHHFLACFLWFLQPAFLYNLEPPSSGGLSPPTSIINHRRTDQHGSIERTYVGGWRDGSEVKSTDCSSRRPRFNSQHPHGSSQLSVTPVPGNLTPLHQLT